jgi:hypothetical protein
MRLVNGLPRPRVVLATALTLVAVLTVVISMQQLYRVKTEDNFNDFDRWMTMVPAWVSGSATYVDDLLPTPPISLFALGPLSSLSRSMSHFVWALCKLPFVCGVFLLATGTVKRAGITLSSEALILIVLCGALPFVEDLQQGQVNFLALLPLAAGLYVAQQETVTADIGAGMLIGLAASVKVTPAIFLAYFFWKRRWLVAIGGAGGLATGLLFAPAAVFGWERNLRWLGDWARVMIVPYVTRGTIVYGSSQSAGSFGLRLLSATPAFEIHHETFEYGYMNVASLSIDAVRLIVRSAMIAVGAAGLWWMRRPLETLRAPRYVLEIGVVAAFMLWFSERTWIHHYVSFVLTLSAAGMVLSDASIEEKHRRPLKFALIVYLVGTLFTSDLGHVFGRQGVQWAKASGVYLWGSAIVVIAMLRAAGWSRNVSSSASVESSSAPAVAPH